MRIEIKPPSGQAMLLGDDSRRLAINGYLPSPEWQIQVRTGIRATNVKLSKRLNCKWTVPFTVDWFYDSEEEALSALTDFPLSIPLQGTLSVIQASRTRYFINATKQSVKPVEHIGCSVRFSFQFIAEDSVTQL